MTFVMRKRQMYLIVFIRLITFDEMLYIEEYYGQYEEYRQLKFFLSNV